MLPSLAEVDPLTEGADIIQRRSVQWIEQVVSWRRALDTLEGGDRYRMAIYGMDRRGLPIYNLIRHKREYPDPREASTAVNSWLAASSVLNATYGAAGPFPGQYGSDPAAIATDNDFEMRRARTPVPTFLSETIEEHLSKIFRREVRRDGPDALVEWWKDVDGKGSPIDLWMAEVVAPLLLTLGQLDIAFDHPPAPPGVEVRSQRDVVAHGLDRCVASVILPENMVDWEVDKADRYTACLVQEYPTRPVIEPDPDDETGKKTRLVTAKDVSTDMDVPVSNYRLWRPEASYLLDYRGECKAVIEHGYGSVPIRRLFDRRKVRTQHVGQSRYWGIIEKSREFYNRDSELILSDTTQAHPLLQGPEDYIQSDGSVPVGPSWLLPKKKSPGDSPTYEGFDVVNFPKEGAESIRQNKRELRDEIDREGRLTKPAGVAGTGGTTVAQSGVSKSLDHESGHELLGKIAAMLGRQEKIVAEYALLVLGDGAATPEVLDAIDVVYPADFCLKDAKELGEDLAEFQSALSLAGGSPQAEIVALQRMYRMLVPGLPDEEYDNIDAEIEEVVLAKSAMKAMAAEAQRALTNAAVGQAAKVGDVVDSSGADDGGAEDPPIHSPQVAGISGVAPFVQ